MEMRMVYGIESLGAPLVEPDDVVVRIALRILDARGPRLHQMSWDQYVGPAPWVMPESEFGLRELKYISDTEAALREAFREAHEAPGRYALIRASRPDLCCLVGRDGCLLLVSADAKTLYGGLAAGTTLILPEHRGQGLSKEIHLSIDGDQRSWLAPTHYSEGGIGARRGAHRVATMRALEAGLTDIHPDNLMRYAADGDIGHENEAPPTLGF